MALVGGTLKTKMYGQEKNKNLQQKYKQHIYTNANPL